MRFILVDPEGTIEAEVAGGATQRQVALTYALTIRSQHSVAVDWPRINRTILSKWKPSGLERIKKMAWDFCMGKKEVAV